MTQNNIPEHLELQHHCENPKFLQYNIMNLSTIGKNLGGCQNSNTVSISKNMDYKVKLLSRIYTEYIIPVRFIVSFVMVTIYIFNN
jgi:hypothetical protein